VQRSQCARPQRRSTAAVASLHKKTDTCLRISQAPGAGDRFRRQFVDLLVNDPVRLTELTLAEYTALGGMEGAEVIMWLVMRGALSASVVKRHSAYYLPSMTGICTAVFENQASAPVAGEVQRQRDRTALQTRGVQKLAGTYPYTLQRSIKALRLNRFLHAMTQPSHREAFRQDEESLYQQHQLSEVECQLLRLRDWRGLIHYGAIFFVLEKWAAVLGVSNLHIYAAMRGQSLDEFLQTRNAPGAIYSVAAVPQEPLPATTL